MSPGVSSHLYLVTGHDHGQPVPGVIRQAQGEGLHPEPRPGHVEQPQHVLAAAALDLQHLAGVRGAEGEQGAGVVSHLPDRGEEGELRRGPDQGHQRVPDTGTVVHGAGAAWRNNKYMHCVTKMHLGSGLD